MSAHNKQMQGKVTAGDATEREKAKCGGSGQGAVNTKRVHMYID